MISSVMVEDEGCYEALGQRLNAVRPRLVGWVARQLGPQTRRHFTAEDIVNDVFASALMNVASLPAMDVALWRWLHRAATNRLNDQLRYLRRNKRTIALRAAVSGSGLVAVCSTAPAECRSPSSEAAAREAVAAMKEALQELKPEHRRAITLRHIYGQALATVARNMHMNPRAVQGLIQRGIVKLRTELGKSGKFFKGRRKNDRRARRDE